MRKQPYLHDRIPQDDPNYEVVKNSILQAWADSHGLVADCLAGRVSLSDYVEGCINTFRQGAQIHVDLEDSASTSDKCAELDRMASRFIRRFNNALSPCAKRFGKTKVKAAIEELSRQVNEIAARSKQRICEGELAGSEKQQSKPCEGDNPSPAVECETRRKRGPIPDYEIASRLAEIVKTVAPDGDWRQHLDDICDALDEAKVPCPKVWKDREVAKSWFGSIADDTGRSRHRAIEAINYRLELARKGRK